MGNKVGRTVNSYSGIDFNLVMLEANFLPDFILFSTASCPSLFMKDLRH